MADYSKITDIRDRRLKSGEVLDDSLVTDIEKFPGLTDELAAEALIKKYPYDFPGVKSGTFTVPTLDAMISSLPGISGENKFDDFINGFPTKQEEWHEEIKKNPKFGERGWKHLKSLWEQASIDRMNSEILKQRDYALHGMDENGNIVRPLDYAAGKMADFFTPRRMKAYREGSDPRPSETLMDFAQNAAYMVPMGGLEAAVARGTGKAALGAVGGAAAAPSAIVAADYGLGTKEYAGAPDALLDAGVGTATNLGVNKLIAPTLGMLLNLGRVRGTLPKWAREFLENNTSEKSKAYNLVNEAERKLKAHYRETNAEYADKLRKGQTPDRLTPEQVEDYTEILQAAEVPAMDKYTADQFNEGWKIMRDMAKVHEGKMSTDPAHMMWYRNNNRLPPKKSLGEMVNEAYGYGSLANGRDALVRHPELISLYEKRGLRDYVLDPSTYVDVLKSYAVNQAGDDAAAQRVLSRLGIDVKDLRKSQDEGRKERKVSGAVSTILAGRRGDLSPESVKYLQMIKDNPSIVVTGINDPVERDSFNMWLLREGNEILRGTAASRPTWEVK